MSFFRHNPFHRFFRPSFTPHGYNGAMYANSLLHNCSESMLGNLSATYLCQPISLYGGYEHADNNKFNTSANIKGVELPARVIEQLRLLGMPLSWYNAGELEDAVEACSFDGVLIDDPSGVNFRDKLRLCDDEKEKRIERNSSKKPPIQVQSPSYDRWIARIRSERTISDDDTELLSTAI